MKVGGWVGEWVGEWVSELVCVCVCVCVCVRRDVTPVGADREGLSNLQTHPAHIPLKAHTNSLTHSLTHSMI